MKILLIANYLPDKQESMQRFAGMLYKGLLFKGCEVRIVRPEPFFGGIPGSYSVQGKWLGYVDKFLLFPQRLRKETKWADIVHICDHSNAIYVRYLKDKCHIVTCHDVLAIRGALGEQTDCRPSLTGKILQSWILDGLRRAQNVACDSASTQKDLLRLLSSEVQTRVRVIPLALNHPYRQRSETESEERLATIHAGLCKKPYVLHVGSNHCRKNRHGVIEIFCRAKDRWPGSLVFAGEELSRELRDAIRAHKIESRVICVAKPDNDALEALYNRAFAFLYPSRFEGYGWPIIEAQACGCPVLCSSDCGPFPEIVRDSAMMCPADDIDCFAGKLFMLLDVSERQKWIDKGLENIKRFCLEDMISNYIGLYDEIRANDKKNGSMT